MRTIGIHHPVPSHPVPSDMTIQVGSSLLLGCKKKSGKKKRENCDDEMEYSVSPADPGSPFASS